MTLDDLIPTRRSLLVRLKDWGDERSWRHFFDTYWRLIYQTALKSGLRQSEAEDVVQETIVSVCKAIGRLDYSPDKGSFKGWLLNLTRWRIKDQFRKRLGRPPGPGEEAGPEELASLEELPDPKAASDFERLWEEEWQHNLITAAMDRVKQRVSERQFQLFDLYVLKKWPLEKITAAFQVGAARVYLAKHRVGKLVKQEVANLQRETT